VQRGLVLAGVRHQSIRKVQFDPIRVIIMQIHLEKPGPDTTKVLTDCLVRVLMSQTANKFEHSNERERCCFGYFFTLCFSDVGKVNALRLRLESPTWKEAAIGENYSDSTLSLGLYREW
jgi:hypothetical protein